MKTCIWIIVISFCLNQEMILARLYGFPNYLESNTHNDGKTTRLAYRGKMIELLAECVQELGLRGMCFKIFC